MSTARDVARAVVRIPRDFDARGDVSFHTLLLESGYADQHDTVDVRMIEDVLRADPEFVTDWLQYSENKRSSAGWYFRKGAPSRWEVGYAGTEANKQASSYREQVTACADFIKKEIEAIRGL